MDCPIFTGNTNKFFLHNSYDSLYQASFLLGTDLTTGLLWKKVTSEVILICPLKVHSTRSLQIQPSEYDMDEQPFETL